MNQVKVHTFKSPYIPLFILGAFNAILGAGIWIAAFYGHQLVKDLLFFHKEMMFGGFFLSFAMGFLFTAIPHFTNTLSIKKKELGIYLVFDFAMIMSLFFDQFFLMAICVLCKSIGSFYFILSRYYSKRKLLPTTFIFLLVGLFFMIVAQLLYLSNEGSEYFRLSLMEFGFALNLIVGIGVKVLPNLLGTVKRPPFSIMPLKESLLQKWYNQNNMLMMALLLNMALIFDFFQLIAIANIWRSMTLLIILITQMKILKLPPARSFVAYGVFLALWFLPVGIFLRGLSSIHIFGLHLYFISGLGLLIMMVAGRVSVAHGGFDLVFEKKEKRIALIIIAAIFTAMMRFLPVWGNQFDFITYLTVSFYAWASFFIIWFIVFGAKLIAPLKRRIYV